MNGSLTLKQAATVGVTLIVASLPALFMQGAVADAVALQATVSVENAYWQPSHFALLYVAVPLLMLSGCVVALAPGLLFSAAWAAPRNPGEWILQGFAFSLVSLAVAAGAAHAFVDGPLARGAFLLVFSVVLMVAAATLAFRSKTGHAVLPVAERREYRQLIPMLCAPVLICALLTPKFLWENLNGDGAHAFEAARLLLTQPLPFWNPAAGDVANWPGTTSLLFTYPTSWFIQLFGPHEVAARAPLLLYLICVFAGIAALAQSGRGRALSMTESWLVWLALFVYIVVVGYSGTYSPYSADLALPGTQDTLLVVCFLGFIVAAERQATLWLSLWGVFTFLTLPNGILLMALWWAATLLVWRPLPIRLLAIIAGIGIGCVVLGMIIPPLVVALGAFGPGKELKTGALLDRFNYVQLTELRRFLYVILPCGILPALALGWWRKHDNLSRTVALVTVVYFGITYIQAYASLHYYIPSMLLPLAVYWRTDWVVAEQRKLLWAGTAAAALIALWISWPVSAVPYLAARQVGAAVDDRVGGYDVSSAEQFRASALLNKLLPPDWDASVPARAHGGSALTWNFYAHIADKGKTNYFLQRAADAPPAFAMQLAGNREFRLFVRDSAVWAHHRGLRPHSPAGARVYQIPRAVLFKAGSGDLRIFNVKRILRRLFG